MKCPKIGRNTVHQRNCRFVTKQMNDLFRDSATSIHYEMPIDYMRSDTCTTLFPRVDLAMRNPISGVNRMIDFTFPVINNRATAEYPTVELAATRKHNFYNDNFNYKNEFVLVPGAIETYGRNCMELNKFIRDVAREGTQHTEEYAKTVNQLRTAIAWMHVCTIGDQQVQFLRENRF